MIKLLPSTSDDVARIREWTAVDIYHRDINVPEWWLTGNGLLSFVLTDDKGPLCYIRLDRDDSRVRINTQFAPYEDVNKIRLVKGMLKCIPVVIQIAKDNKATGLVFSSTSPALVAFMKSKFGFEPAQDGDYVLAFGDV